ncbi:MAG: hypothetical protein JW795_02835, partial [Chitinivibrionales bacterium]|nr:hypothetical protein [Chitinivibrionales bacterium]
ELEVLGHTLSHDLRKPLAGIQEFSTILLDDHSRQLDETGLYLLRQVRQNAFAMEEMITGLLNISRIGLTELRREQINISAAVQTIVDELVREEPNRSVQVTIAENQIVSVDGALVRIFLDNIIRNAWKFTRKQPAGLIEFGVFRQEGGKKTFFLADNGVGFDMEQGDKLFTIFQRLHSSADFEGSGTGLATAQRIIRRHGGDIWAQGQIDKGATIYFNFEK